MVAQGSLASSTSSPGGLLYILLTAGVMYLVDLSIFCQQLVLPGRPRPTPGWWVGQGGVSGQEAPPQKQR